MTVFESIVSRTPVDKGWSGDRKYKAFTADGSAYFLRISPMSKFEKLKLQFSHMQKVQALGTTMCKNLMLCNRQQTDFYLLLMSGDKPFKTSVLSKQIGSSRLSFADGSFMEQFLDITPGSLSILGLMNDLDHRVRLLIDEDVLTGPSIGVHPCINTSSLSIATADLTEKLIPALGHAPTLVNL